MSEHPPPANRLTEPGGTGHPEIDELAAYADSEIDVGGAGLVRAHLADCADCAADLAALDQARDQLAGLASPSMPADAIARLDAAIARAGAAPPVAATVLPSRTARRTPGWATGAAAAAVIALVAAVAVGALTRVRGNSKTTTKEVAAAVLSGASGRRYVSGTNYTRASIAKQVSAVLGSPAHDGSVLEAPSAFAGDEASDAAAATASAGASAAAAAPTPAAAGSPRKSSPTAADSAPSAAAELQASALPVAPPATPPATPSVISAAAPPADLSALRSDPARLTRCIQSVTEGLTEPLAIDFAAFEGRPALAIVLPTKTPGVTDVFVVGGECGAGADATVLHYARVSAG